MRAYDLLFSGVLSRLDPERAHHLGFAGIKAAGAVAPVVAPRRTAVRAMGIDFPEVLGVAAGFDKDAAAIDGLAALGFGFVEVGTVTGEPQAGNATPRLARLVRDEAVVNRMGFNNAGAEAVARRLARRVGAGNAANAQGGRSFPVPLGVNIGKTKVVPEEAAVADYEKSTGLLAPYADYLVVNVSSPNTPGLRDLQAVEKLEPLLSAVRRRADEATEHQERRVPLCVKIAPDLADDDVRAVGDLAVALGLDGVVATNTTIGRTGLTTPHAEVEAAGAGGLSGRPLRGRAEEVVRVLRDQVGPEMTIVGVGGIDSVESARSRLEAGATLLQAYTAFIYRGPTWPRSVNAGLVAKTGVRR
ncbi:quinone-dependent dihydroorotate dehydrogenase [Nocardioidaceae bacterium]|nr:quinone-dependent dihydroorotate dehydrogenase [Nocardioidaceae bacterium]